MRVRWNLLLLLLLLLSSCAFFIQQADKEDNEKLKSIQLQPTTKLARCPQANRSELFTTHQHALTSMLEFKKIASRHGEHFSFVEEMVIWALIQMRHAPFLSSASADIQFTYQVAGKLFHLRILKQQYDHRPNELTLPYLYGLALLLKKHSPSRTLIQLAALTDSLLPSSIIIDDNFAQFIKDNQTEISADPILQGWLLRTGEPLRAGEKIDIPRPYHQLVLDFQKSFDPKNYIVNEELIPLAWNKNNLSTQYDHTILCNQQVAIEREFMPILRSSIQSNVFGIQRDQYNFALISSHQKHTQKLTPIKNALSLSGGNGIGAFPLLCLYQSHQSTNAHQLLLHLSQGPLLEQHLAHLLTHNSEFSNHSAMDNIIQNKARYLKVEGPRRIYVEGPLVTQSEIDALLTSQVPIYSKQSLAQVVVHLSSSGLAGFITDNRQNFTQACSGFINTTTPIQKEE